MLLDYLEGHVKPDRYERNDENGKKVWWEHLRNRKSFYQQIRTKKYVNVGAVVSKYPEYLQLPSSKVYNNKVVMFDLNGTEFCIINSVFHKEWVYKRSTTMGASTINYTTKECFETFPLLISENPRLEGLGILLSRKRSEIFSNIRLGLTKSYNQFHNQDLVLNFESVENNALEEKYGKETWNLFNHLNIKKEGKISYEEAVPLIFQLRELHEKIDEAVLEAYGWHQDDQKWGKAIQLRHDFYEVDYLPENDRVRYTIHPDARKEILKRLLDLNHQYFEEEAKNGLHKKEDVESFYGQKGKPVPEEVSKCFGKKKGKEKPAKDVKTKVSKSTPQTSLFEATTPLFSQPSVQKISVGSKVTIRSTDAKEMKYIIQATGEKGSFTSDGFKLILADSSLAQSILGKGEGDQFEFGGVGYRVLNVK